MKALSLLGALIVIVWKISAMTIGVQQTINSRIERLENKVEIFSLTQTNQFKINKNDRKRDSTDNANGQKEIKEQIYEMRNLLLKFSPYNQKSISSN